MRRRDERFDRLYDEAISMAERNGLEMHELVDFMLSFIIFNLSPSFDEEDAREFCRALYKSILEFMGMRRCRNE